MFRRSTRNQNSKSSSTMVNCISKSGIEQSPPHQPTSTANLYPKSCHRSSSSPSSAVLLDSVGSTEPQQANSTHSSEPGSVQNSFKLFYDRLETLSNCRPKEIDGRFGQPIHLRPHSIRVARAECERVGRQYFSLRSTPLTERTKHSLTCHTFNHWFYSDAHLLHYLKFMFLDLELPKACRFPVELLETWLLAVYGRYNDVPFHNFKHAFAVTQMMYSIIKQTQLQVHLSHLDLFVLMFSALSHDLDHPGFTNSYQVNAHSWLAMRYNDSSPLENHHCATAFELVSIPATNILCGLTVTELRWFRKAVIRCILATDMATHNECSEQFRQLLPRLTDAVRSPASCSSGDNFVRTGLRRFLDENSELRLALMLILLKTCDISNETRPAAISDPWLGCLLDEFFFQANAERKIGLPVAPYMDPEKVTRSNSQLGFLNNVLIPLLEDVTQVFPQLYPLLLATRERLSHYSRLSEQQLQEPKQQPPESKRSAPKASSADIPAPKLPSPSLQLPSPSVLHISPSASGLTVTSADSLNMTDASPVRLLDPSQAVAITEPRVPVMDVDTNPKSSSLISADPPPSVCCTTDIRNRSINSAVSGYFPDSPDVPVCSSDFDCARADLTEWSIDNVPSRKSSTGSMVLANS
ncbi:High affinity cGMP-specific 3',5'-cyclic phosphodiesterase 9A [Clonorchis sinensis]|uniref:Phosphodiesterase n=1 Tax=Clonorchis sinensis TaxID=79923 RepID=A0A8T1LXQ0_CLOSI|nr:High affinity cGMP-specific 3',5'-cyclic phosphodiesterase 9A [Clonorchis sinensis]